MLSIKRTSLPRLMSRVRIPSPAPIQSLVFTRLFPYLYHFLPCIKRHEKAQKNTEKHINTYINTAIIGQKLGSKKESCKSSLVSVDSAVYLIYGFLNHSQFCFKFFYPLNAPVEGLPHIVISRPIPTLEDIYHFFIRYIIIFMTQNVVLV